MGWISVLGSRVGGHATKSHSGNILFLVAIVNATEVIIIILELYHCY
jgi:hypothetical protein